MQKKTARIEQRIEAIKAELTGLGDMRPGSLSTQSRSWGGQYCQLSYTHRGKGHTEYIQDNIREQTKQQLQNYKKFKALTLEWVDRAIELARIKAQLKKEKSSKKH
jgi:hypothetical protein